MGGSVTPVERTSRTELSEITIPSSPKPSAARRVWTLLTPSPAGALTGSAVAWYTYRYIMFHTPWFVTAFKTWVGATTQQQFAASAKNSFLGSIFGESTAETIGSTFGYLAAPALAPSVDEWTAAACASVASLLSIAAINVLFNKQQNHSAPSETSTVKPRIIKTTTITRRPIQKNLIT